MGLTECANGLWVAGKRVSNTPESLQGLRLVPIHLQSLHEGAEPLCRWFACFNRRDKQGMLSLLSDDCQFESLALQETFDSPQVLYRVASQYVACCDAQCLNASRSSSNHG